MFAFADRRTLAAIKSNDKDEDYHGECDDDSDRIGAILISKTMIRMLIVMSMMTMDDDNMSRTQDPNYKILS